MYIKELNTPNILKSQCKYKCDYLLVKAYTGSVAMAIVQDYVVEYEEKFRPVYYNKLEGGVPIDNKKVLFEEEQTTRSYKNKRRLYTAFVRTNVEHERR